MGNTLVGMNQMGLLNAPKPPGGMALPATDFNGAVGAPLMQNIQSAALPKTDFNAGVPSASTQINPMSMDTMMQRMASMNQNKAAIPTIADIGAMSGGSGGIGGGMQPMQPMKSGLGSTMQGIEGLSKMVAKL